MKNLSLAFFVGSILLVLSAFFAYSFVMQPNFPNVEEGKWQAVFLSNDQVYFGKIEEVNTEYISLTNVYYLRTLSDLEKNDAGQSLNLVKLGGELHGPEDLMYIPKKNIMFWENLKSNSRVLKLIQTTLN